MADVKWIKLMTDMFDNRKIKHLRKLPEGNNIVLIWVMLLTMAGRCNANGMIFLTENILYTPKMLADELDFDENTVILALNALEEFGMICRDGRKLLIYGWEEHQNIEGLDKIREQTRKRVAKHRENQKMLESTTMSMKRYSNVTVTQCNATEEDIEIDIDKDINNINSASDNAPKVSKSDISEFFESIWKLYPNKKGKGQVSDSKKKALYEIGFEKMARAIERYKSDLEKDEWRNAQNGSTFFNSGYVDYLDENYEPPKQQPVKKNGFNNFNGRDYDRQAMQRMQLALIEGANDEQDPDFLAERDEMQKRLKEKYGKG